MNSELVDDHEVGNASYSIVSPLGALTRGEGSKEASQNHDDVSDDGNEYVGTAQSSEEAEIHEQKWSSNAPIDITSPVDLTLNLVDLCREVLVFNLDQGGGEGNTITVGHGIVRDCGEGGDEGSQDVEEAFLLDGDRLALYSPNASRVGITYDRDAESHGVEGEGGDDHDHEDDPKKL